MHFCVSQDVLLHWDIRSRRVAVQLLITTLLFQSQPAALTTWQQLCVANDASLFDLEFPRLYRSYPSCSCLKGLINSLQNSLNLYVYDCKITFCVTVFQCVRAIFLPVCAWVRVCTKPARWCMGINTHRQPRGLSLCFLEVHVYLNGLLMTWRVFRRGYVPKQ